MNIDFLENIVIMRSKMEKRDILKELHVRRKRNGAWHLSLTPLAGIAYRKLKPNGTQFLYRVHTETEIRKWLLFKKIVTKRSYELVDKIPVNELRGPKWEESSKKITNKEALEIIDKSRIR